MPFLDKGKYGILNLKCGFGSIVHPHIVDLFIFHLFQEIYKNLILWIWDLGWNQSIYLFFNKVGLKRVDPKSTIKKLKKRLYKNI